MFFFNRIKPEIQKALFKRINALNRVSTSQVNTLNPISEVEKNPLDLMLTKSCWVRVHSTLPDFAKDENGKIKKPLQPYLDDEGRTKGEKPFRLSGYFKDGQQVSKPLSTKVDLLNNPAEDHLRAPVGITGVNCSFMDKSVQKVTVNFKVYDTEDFDVYEQAFLKHGRTVLVEFGWSTPDTNYTTLKTKPEMLDYFNNIQDRILDGNGDYHAAIGTITNFTFTIGQNGEYDCSFDLVSLGSTLFKGQVDSGNNDIPELIEKQNDETYSEAYKRSRASFESVMKNFDSILKDEMERYPQDVYYNEKTEKGYCTWGYFEDVIVNKFFGTTSEIKQGDGSSTLTTKILSAQPFSIDNEVVMVSNRCRNSKHLFTKSTDIIFPGQIIGLDGGWKDATEGRITENSETIEEYQNTYDTYFDINSKFKPFANNAFEYYDVEGGPTAAEGTNSSNVRDLNTVKEEEGFIRNITFSSNFLRNNFSYITNLEDGLENFWMTVSNFYGQFWDFGIFQDQNNNGQVGIADRNVTNLPMKPNNPELFPRAKSTEDDPTKTFVFPVYSNRSLFKDFSIDVSITSAMATQAMFYGNKDYTTKGLNQTTGKPENKALKALGLLSNITIDSSEDNNLLRDGMISNITFPYLKGLGVKLKTDGNKIVLDEFGNPEYELLPDNLGKSISVLDKTTKEALAEQGITSSLFDMNKEYRWLTTKELLAFDKAGLIYEKNGTMLPSYQQALDYYLVKGPDSDKGLLPVTPIKVSFTLNGIGGIRMFDMFAVDYIPYIYRRFGLFQVQNIDHTLSPNGWDTKISALLRLDIEEMLKELSVQFDAPEIALGIDNTNENLKTLYRKGDGASGESQTDSSTQATSDTITNPIRETGDADRDVIEQTQVGSEVRTSGGQVLRN